MKKITLCLLTAVSFLLSGIPVLAQKGFSITAILSDESNSEPVAYATVSITAKGATKPAKYILSDDEGKVLLEAVKPGVYSFKAELMGYDPVSREITVEKKDLDLGALKMKPDTKLLDAASISATGNPIIIKKDTIEYNATSFKTTDNDVLEDLLKKLPGVEVSEDGSVTVNGKSINKITIDGKTFFLDDPQLASKNIPAKIINKVKVVEKKSDQAEFTGIDDGQEETIIDLNIKPGMMKGLFGNATAGAGHDVPTTTSEYDDWRWQGAAFVGKFDDKTQLSLILNANNTNNRAFRDLSGSMMGGMRGGGGGMGRGQGGWGNSNGITTSYMGGVNAAADLFDDKMNIGGNYLYNATRTDVLENSRRTTYLDDYNRIYDTDGSSNTNTYGNRMGMRLEHKFSENTSILFEPWVNFGTGDFSQYSSYTTDYDLLDGSALKNINHGVTLNSGSNKNWNAGGFFLFRQRLGIPGRTFSTFSRFNFSDNDLRGMNQSLTSAFDTGVQVDSVTNQRYVSNQKNSSVSVRMTYTEPLGNHFYVEGNYSFSWNESRSSKDTYDNADNTGFADGNFFYNETGEVYNPVYSNSILNRYYNQQFGGNVMYQNDIFRAQVGFGANPTKTHNETVKAGTPRTYDSMVWKFAPQAMLFYDPNESTAVRFFYFGRSSQPSTNQLMPVPDNTDPLNVSFGNPTLKPYFSHDMRGEFRTNNKETFASLNVNVDGGFVQSPIVNATWYGDNGAQYSMPYNGPTSGRANMYMFINSPIAKSDFSIFSMSIFNWSKSSSYVGKNVPIASYYDGGELDYEAFLRDFPDLDNSAYFTRNTTETLGLMQRLRLTYRLDNLELRAGGRTRMNRSWYTIADKVNTTTWNNQLDCSINWTWESTGLTLKSDFDYNWYRGYSTPQASEYILNAEINKLLFDNKVTLGLKGYDILGQSKNLTVTDAANYHSEVVNNTLQRYVILSLTYRFGTFNRDRMPGGGGPGSRGPGGPRPR